jgi:hypothetical protein
MKNDIADCITMNAAGKDILPAVFLKRKKKVK